MRIEAVEVFKENMLLSKPYQIAYKVVDSVECLFLRIRLENGITGWGSSNISTYVVGQSNDDTLAHFQEGQLDFLLRKDIRQFKNLIESTNTQLCNSIGLKVMADVALYDVFSKYLGIPMVDLWGAKHRRMATSVTIGIMGVDPTIEEAKAFVDAGFQVLKVKLGAALQEDIERLVALRKTFGNEIKIRIDANQGWTLAETLQFFETTQLLDIELIEQPVKADELHSVLSLPQEYRDKIAADESLRDSADAALLSGPERPVGIFNIKLMKCGGITEAMKIADFARSTSIDLMWGCNDESIVSITAALHAAFACEHTKYLDLDGSFDLARDVVEGGFILENGCLSFSRMPGLGIQPIAD